MKRKRKRKGIKSKCWSCDTEAFISCPYIFGNKEIPGMKFSSDWFMADLKRGYEKINVVTKCRDLKRRKIFETEVSGNEEQKSKSG